jgi:outer membrane protein assembly factor BamB
MRIFPFVSIILSLAVMAAGCSSTSGSTETPEEVPASVTQWAPVGARAVGNYPYDVIPQPNGFHTMHVGPNNTDNVWVAVAPELELDWVAEQSFYVPEGPTYDNEGNLYFSPLFPKEDVSLVSLDAETGERNWAIEGNGRNAGGGATLVLNDPDNAGTQVIYHCTYTEAMAIQPNGTILWRRPTGLTLPPVVPGERGVAHSYGFNYHPQTDTVIVLMASGEILAFDRITGAPVASGQVPGSPAVSDLPFLPEDLVAEADALTDEVFGTTPSGLSFFSLIVEVIFGGGSVITNYFAIDPNTGRIYVAATDEDEADGTSDGLSERGALYALDLVGDGTGGLDFEITNSIAFDGGTGSTPSVSEDGSRVYISDNVGNVIALTSDLEELWRYDLEELVAASVGVSPDNKEVYAVTRRDVFKLIDEGDHATLDWIATLDAFADDPDIEVEFQALTPTITANGIAVAVGGGKLVLTSEVMLKVGVGLLDRETGELRSFALGREESIAVTSVAADGGIYTASSPLRRAAGKARYPDLAEDVIGGISRYKPVRNDLLVRDASCAAGVRARNAATIAGSATASAEQDIRQVRVLIEQGRAALDRAVADGDLDADVASALDVDLASILGSLSVSTLDQAGNALIRVCSRLADAE